MKSAKSRWFKIRRFEPPRPFIKRAGFSFQKNYRSKRNFWLGWLQLSNSGRVRANDCPPPSCRGRGTFWTKSEPFLTKIRKPTFSPPPKAAGRNSAENFAGRAKIPWGPTLLKLLSFLPARLCPFCGRAGTIKVNALVPPNPTRAFELSTLLIIITYFGLYHNRIYNINSYVKVYLFKRL